jgi:glutaredoxin 3
MKPPQLNLYYFDSCPYCQFVLLAIKKYNIKVTYKNIHEDPDNFKILLKDTGRGTTPCLYVDGKPMHESREIVTWLEKN